MKIPKNGAGDSAKSVKVTKNGPYVVKGDIPLIKSVIEIDEEGYPARIGDITRIVYVIEKKEWENEESMILSSLKVNSIYD